MILRGMDRGRYATDAPPRKVPSAGASDNSSRLYRDAVRPTLKTFRVRTKDPYTNAASHELLGQGRRKHCIDTVTKLCKAMDTALHSCTTST